MIRVLFLIVCGSRFGDSKTAYTLNPLTCVSKDVGALSVYSVDSVPWQQVETIVPVSQAENTTRVVGEDKTFLDQI